MPRVWRQILDAVMAILVAGLAQLHSFEQIELLAKLAEETMDRRQAILDELQHDPVEALAQLLQQQGTSQQNPSTGRPRSRSRSRSRSPRRQAAEEVRPPLISGRLGTRVQCRRCGNETHSAEQCPVITTELRCRRCGRNGHIAYQCPKVECRLCGARGHISNMCPTSPNAGRCLRCGKSGHFVRQCRQN